MGASGQWFEFLQKLGAECTNEHVHLPWGTTPYGFATANEVEYPFQVCKRWAQLVYDAISPHYQRPRAALPPRPDKNARNPFLEWNFIQYATITELPSFTIGMKLKAATRIEECEFPPHARILRIMQKTIANMGEEKQLWEVAFGVPCEAPGKRFLVLKEMLAELDFPDQANFDLVCTAGAEGLLPAGFQPATLTVEDLEAPADRSNKAIMHSCKPSGSLQVDQELWNKTLEEASKGLEQRVAALRPSYLVQSDEVRPIDNCSESQVNNGVTVTNKCTVDAVDTIVGAMACQFMKKLRKKAKEKTGRSFGSKVHTV
eukprot:s64_g29.t1